MRLDKIMTAAVTRPFCTGFSLIEMIIALSVLGILSASTAVFLRGPINSYFDTERRGDLANAGELAMAKMAQEISNAVPNSVRVTPSAGGGFYLEFLPVISEGIYATPEPYSGPNTRFSALCGPPIPCPTGAAGDWVIINNYVASDAWANPAGTTSRARLTSIAPADRINHSSKDFVLPDGPDYRFQIAADPVTYFCDPSPGVGTLTRYSGYGAPSTVQPQPPAVLPSILARQITACGAQVVAGNLRRAQVVALTLTFAAGTPAESLNLYHVIRVEPLP